MYQLSSVICCDTQQCLLEIAYLLGCAVVIPDQPEFMADDKNWQYIPGWPLYYHSSVIYFWVISFQIPAHNFGGFFCGKTLQNRNFGPIENLKILLKKKVETPRPRVLDKLGDVLFWVRHQHHSLKWLKTLVASRGTKTVTLYLSCSLVPYATITTQHLFLQKLTFTHFETSNGNTF